MDCAAGSYALGSDPQQPMKVFFGGFLPLYDKVAFSFFSDLCVLAHLCMNTKCFMFMSCNL